MSRDEDVPLDVTGRMRRGAIRLQDLRYFLGLAAELSFTRAAARAYLTQQAFSARIKLLENQLGFPLFVRTSRYVSLTPEGRKLVDPVRQVLELLDEALDDVCATLDGRGRPLRVGIHMFGASELTSRILAAFAERAPDIPVELYEIEYGTLISVACDHGVDVAFAWLPVPAADLDLVELGHEPIVMAVSRRSPLAARSAVTMAEALRQPVVVVRGEDTEFTDFWLFRTLRDEPPLIGATVGTSVEEVEAVAAGKGCVFVPASVARLFNHPEIRYVSITDGPLSTLVLAWRDTRASAQRTFVQVARGVVRDQHVVALETDRRTT